MSNERVPSRSAGSAANRLYIGTRCSQGNPCVTVNGKRFDPRPSQRVRHHSPNGFEWGYSGSGPAQLALAILLDATDGNVLVATEWYQTYKFQTVAGWSHAGFATTRAAVLKWLAARLSPFPTDLPQVEDDAP